MRKVLVDASGGECSPSPAGWKDRSHGGEFPLPQLVAIDDCARSARHIEEDAALDKRVYARVAEQDQRGTIIVAARNLLREMRIKPRQRGAA